MVNTERRECDKCKKLFPVYDLDLYDGIMVCRECEDIIEDGEDFSAGPGPKEDFGGVF